MLPLHSAVLFKELIEAAHPTIAFIAVRPLISLGMWTDGRRIAGNLVLDAANPFQHTGLQAEAHCNGPVLKVIVTVLPLVASCPATGD